MLLNELILKNFYKKNLINIIQKFLSNDQIQKTKNSSNNYITQRKDFDSIKKLIDTWIMKLIHY